MVRATTWSAGSDGRRRDRGVTIVELLAVLAIIGILGGISIAAFISFGSHSKGMSFLNQVDALVRNTRNFSISQSSPSFILFDKEERKITSVGKRPVGVWHLEDLNGAKSTGGQGLDVETVGAALSPEGRYGNCLSFNGSDHAKVLPHHFLNPELGFALSAWIFPEEIVASKAQFIAQKEGDFDIYLGKENQILVNVEGVVISSTVPALQKEWTHVQVVFDGAWLLLRVNGELNSYKDCTGQMSMESGDLGLTFGEDFVGRIDEIIYGIYDKGTAYTIPNDVTLAFTVPTTSGDKEIDGVFFNELGQLDALFFTELANGITVTGTVTSGNRVIDEVKFKIETSGAISRQ